MEGGVTIQMVALRLASTAALGAAALLCAPLPPPRVATRMCLASEATQLLHSAAQAASEQQLRLRKTQAVGQAAGAGRVASAVYLVGVGPGDVELLTVKAVRLMASADLVLYDRLIAPEILSLVNPNAAMLYVGKEAGLHTRPQEQIHELLLQFATSGRTVLRLKGGDPTVFGRGGEELEYLEQRGVPVHIVPGITAAAGIAADLRVPLTHRDYADSVRFITGHARSECTATVQERYDWAHLADSKTTLVIYMGLSTLRELAGGLIEAGLSADTPAVAVQDGTTYTQRVVAAPLACLAEEVEQAGLRSPTLVLIGSVVSLLQQKEGDEEERQELSPTTSVTLTVEQARDMVAQMQPRA
uniref:uroporphyrinogen-III C-methyltransferase n=1 Tax=Calcidiscus leptoporus TaxID=127549 RepID=A0A7S0J265_9EUKA